LLRRDSSVCLSHDAAACLGYTPAGCLQLSHRRSPEMYGLRTRPQTDVNPPRFLDPRWPDWRRNEMPQSNCHRRGAYRLAASGAIPCQNNFFIFHKTHTYPFNGPFSGTRKVKPIWILLKQETVSSSGISWVICKSAPRSRQITTPAPHHSVFYRPDAIPAAQPTASKH